MVVPLLPLSHCTILVDCGTAVYGKVTFIVRHASAVNHWKYAEKRDLNVRGISIVLLISFRRKRKGLSYIRKEKGDGSLKRQETQYLFPEKFAAETQDG